MGIEKFIQKVCVQTAVYWGNPKSDGYGGMTFDDPVDILCRWDVGSSKLPNVIGDGRGNEIITRAEILVTQDLDEQGWLYLGSLSELDPESNDPKLVDGAYEIKRFDKIPMIKKTDVFVRKAYI